MDQPLKKLLVLPEDEHNQLLVSYTHPQDWQNPEPQSKYNLVVIGGGTAGLVVAAGAAGLGAKVALIERHLMGGDCLNYGCVPSKTIIRSAKVAHLLKQSKDFGVDLNGDVQVDFASVMERLRKIRAQISHVDSAPRFTELGVDVFLGEGTFINSNTIQVKSSHGDRSINFKKAVIATGARAAKPRIPGLEEVGYLTNENVFELTEKPSKLAVIGGGPIGCELAQSFRRLGCEVTLFHKNSHLLDKEDPEAAEIIQNTLLEEGIELITNAEIFEAKKENDKKVLVYKNAHNNNQQQNNFDEILLSAGRTPNVENLGLEEVGVAFNKKEGVKVNDKLQTSNANIFAAGDVCMKWKFTHAADAAARIVIQNTLFMGNKKLSDLVMPWCTYTDPEVAHVGLSEAEAIQLGYEVDTVNVSMEHVDRAIADGENNGLIKIRLKKGTDQILGASIVAANAGDMINEITLAIVNKIGLDSLSSVIHPYPTQAEIVKKAADSYRRTLLTPFVKKLFQWWLAVTR